MTETSYFWTTTLGTGDSDPIDQTEWQRYVWRSLVGWGADNANRGVMGGVANELLVSAQSPAAAAVNIGSGAALVNGAVYYNDNTATLSFAANSSGSTRIDVVVLTADYAAPSVRLAVVQGTPAAGVPSLTQTGSGTSGLWQIPLAYVTLTNGYASITAAMITDWRSFANMPARVASNIVNNAVAALEHGAIVIRDTSGGGYGITTTTTQANALAFGIIEARATASGGTGRAVQQGIIEVMCDELVAVGARLETSTTAGQAQTQTQPMQPAIGVVLTANTGAGTRCLAYVDFLPYHGTYTELKRVFTSAGITMNSNSDTLVTGFVATENPYGEFGTDDWTLRAGIYAIAVDTSVGTGGAYNPSITLSTDAGQDDVLWAGAVDIEGIWVTVIQVNGTEIMELYATGGAIAGTVITIARIG